MNTRYGISRRVTCRRVAKEVWEYGPGVMLLGNLVAFTDRLRRYQFDVGRTITPEPVNERDQ